MRSITFSVMCFGFMLHAAIIVPPSPSPAPTPQQMTVRQLKQSANQQFQSLTRSFTQSFNLVWKNPYKLTPQQVFDAVEAANPGHGDAADLFRIAGATQSMVNTITPGTLPQVPPQPYQILSNGTVHVGPSPTPSPSPSPSPAP